MNDLTIKSPVRKPTEDILAIYLGEYGIDPPSVRIRRNGTIEFGPDYNPDEACRMFWNVVMENMPPQLKESP